MFCRLLFVVVFSNLSLAAIAADTPSKASGVASEDISPDIYDTCGCPSGSALTLCALIAEKANVKISQKRFLSIVKTFNAAEGIEANHLRAAAERFAQDRGQYETDATGSARGALAIEARTDELNLFLDDLQGFEAGHFPEVHTSHETAVVDQELNQAYKEVLAMQPDQDNRFGLSEITLEGVRATERNWIAYRNAWVDFGRLRYRKLDAASLQYSLTKRRVAELEDVLYTLRNCVGCP